jgi:methionyl-tRNA formyltransferase
LRVIFMGTPDFSVPILAALLAAGHDVVAVYSQPPRPAGRGQKERPSPVQICAESHGLLVRCPKSLRTLEATAAFQDLAADIAVVAAYGLLLPPAILEAPRLGCINAHASLLPRWRGAAPIQRAIEAGDSETGVTIMQMDEGLDTGAMLLHESCPIGPSTTGGALHDQLAALAPPLVVTALAGLAAGRLVATPQPAEGVTYAPKLAKEEGRIDWQMPAETLDRRIRAFTPWPGAYFEYAGERFKVLAVLPSSKGGRDPGHVLDDCLTVACGSGALRILEVQRAGRAPMTTDALLRGFAMPAGTRLACPATS